jgi:hypothetical protein
MMTTGLPMLRQDELESVNQPQKEKEMITALPILLTSVALEQENSITLPIILAISGSVALLIGLFGGGVKAKEIEIPTLARGARMLSGLFGIVLIGTSIWLSAPNAPPESPTALPIPPTEESASTQIIPTDMPDTTQTPMDTPTNILTNTQTFTPNPTAKPVPEIMPFEAPGNPGLLNPAFGWQPGNSPTNAYDFTASPNTLTLISDGHTDQWAELDSQPMVSYPIEGNFETQVKLVFNPMWGHELAAIGVRSTQDHHTWVRLGGVYAVFSQGSGPEQHIVLDIDHQGQGNKIKTSPYPADSVYLKIERQRSVFDFYYSSDGVNWAALQTGYIEVMPANVEIFLTVGSWGDGGSSAKFYEFKVLSQ